MTRRIIFSVRGNPRRYSMPAPTAYSELGRHLVNAVTREPFVFSERSTMEETAAHILGNMTAQDRPHDTVTIPVYTAEGDVGECSICMENIQTQQEFRRLPCSETVNHCFHKQCIDEWFQTKTNCPNCRSNLRGDRSE